MASLTRPLLAPSPPPAKFLNSDIYPRNPARITPRRRRRRARALIVESSSREDSPAKLLTFLGKGGSGKTTASVFAAQHYAMAGLKTCLVIHTQDPTVDYLLNCKIGTSPVKFNQNLSAVRLETTKMLIEPLNRIKQADARLNMTQGVLEGVVGEELGVLPGMDSVFSALTLERLVGLLGNVGQRSNPKERFDIVIYDGLSTEETIRMIGATSRSRLYLKYMRNLAEKTDIGRLAGPSLVRLAEEAIRGGGGSSTLNGKLSSEIWNDLEQILERGTSFFTEPNRFGCYLVMDPNSPTSLSTALRYWGCLIQSGAQISGAFGISPPTEKLKNDFSPLPLAFIPRLSIEPSLDWNEIMLNSTSHNARALLNKNGGLTSSVKFDAANKSVTLFMPGFDKSEIKLYQYRGGSELLVEAGDQRRIVRLPSQIQGKVKGAKFVDRSVIITMR